jgi:hypothetical protein
MTRRGRGRPSFRNDGTEDTLAMEGCEFDGAMDVRSVEDALEAVVVEVSETWPLDSFLGMTITGIRKESEG